MDRETYLLSAIIDALPDPVLIVDGQHEIVRKNRRATNLFASREGDHSGHGRAADVNNLLFSSFLNRPELEGSKTEGRELTLVDPGDGGDVVFEVLSTSLNAELLHESATMFVLRDISDLKQAAADLELQFKRARQAEAAAQRERDRLNLMIENVSDPILVTDGESNIMLMNREAERLFESTEEGEAGASRKNAVRANDTRFSSFISEFALHPDTTRKAECHFEDPITAARLPMEIVSGKVTNERVETTTIVSILHDLTRLAENERLTRELTRLNEGLEDRVRAATRELATRNRQLEWQSRELETAYRLKSEFVASMSHELRTPINALLGYASLLRDRVYGDLTDKQDESLKRMHGASEHLLELVNDILDLAKIEAGKMPVHVSAVDVRTVVQELAHTIEPMLNQRSLTFELDAPANLSPLRTDETKVKQVILNLLSNAVKFTHEGSVRVEAREVAGCAEITVSDSGIGISEDDLTSIFDDFRQVDQSSTREYGGTGLGLSITRKLVWLLGGRIDVESRLGKGTTFTVRFPSLDESANATRFVSSLPWGHDDPGGGSDSASR